MDAPTEQAYRHRARAAPWLRDTPRATPPRELKSADITDRAGHEHGGLTQLSSAGSRRRLGQDIIKTRKEAAVAYAVPWEPTPASRLDATGGVEIMKSVYEECIWYSDAD